MKYFGPLVVALLSGCATTTTARLHLPPQTAPPMDRRRVSAAIRSASKG